MLGHRGKRLSRLGEIVAFGVAMSECELGVGGQEVVAAEKLSRSTGRNCFEEERS